MPAGQSLGQSFVVPRQRAKPGRPGETPLHHPAARQQHEPSLRLRVLHHLQPHRLRLRLLRRVLPGIALVHEVYVDVVPRRLLHRSDQLADLSVILFLGCRYLQSQQMAQRVHSQVHLGALALLGPVVAGPLAALGGGLDRL
jgi:hypothetical protein